MTPDVIKKATSTLAYNVANFHEARSEGEALGRALAAEVQAREIVTQQINRAAALDMEFELLRLAASSDTILGEVAASALQVLRTALRPDD